MKDEKQPDQRSFHGAHYWPDHSDLEEAHLGEEGWSAVAGVRLFVCTGRALLGHPIAPDTSSFISHLSNFFYIEPQKLGQTNKCARLKTWFV